MILYALQLTIWHFPRCSFWKASIIKQYCGPWLTTVLYQARVSLLRSGRQTSPALGLFTINYKPLLYDKVGIIRIFTVPRNTQPRLKSISELCYACTQVPTANMFAAQAVSSGVSGHVWLISALKITDDWYDNSIKFDWWGVYRHLAKWRPLSRIQCAREY